jgi:hypothetical protein
MTGRSSGVRKARSSYTCWLDHDGYLPRFAVITDGKTHELNVARKLRWEPGTIVVFDA